MVRVLQDTIQVLLQALKGFCHPLLEPNIPNDFHQMASCLKQLGAISSDDFTLLQTRYCDRCFQIHGTAVQEGDDPLGVAAAGAAGDAPQPCLCEPGTGRSKPWAWRPLESWVRRLFACEPLARLVNWYSTPAARCVRAHLLCALIRPIQSINQPTSCNQVSGSDG